MRMLKFPGFVLGSVVLALGLMACGGSGSSSSSASSVSSSSAGAAAPSNNSTSSAAASGSGGSGGALSLAAEPSGQLKFTKSSLSAKAGRVSIQFTNGSPLAHNLTIQQGTSGRTVGATPTFQGGSKALTVSLKPGTYTFFCSVPGHRMAGMQGTLTVS